MASPQKENGYTALANELYDALIRWRFSSYEYRILIFLIRKTYGWNKTSDWISLSQFNEATLIPIPHICRTLKQLICQNVITKRGNPNNPEYSVQKDYEKWILLPKGERSHHPLITKGGNTELPKGVDAKGVIQNTKGGNWDSKRGQIQKTIITKDTITKDIIDKSIKAKPPRKDKIGIITQQDEKTGEITPVMRINQWGEAEPSVYGNRDIGLTLYYFEEHLGGKTDGTALSERRYAKHLIDSLKREYPDQDPVEVVKQLLKLSTLDPWIAKNCTSCRWLYYNKQKVIQSAKQFKQETKGIRI